MVHPSKYDDTSKLSEVNIWRETYLRAAAAVCFIAVDKQDGDEGIGSAFHIGDGIFITARHVVDGVSIREVATTKSIHLEDEAGGSVYRPRRLQIIDGPYFGPDELDVAVFRVDLGEVPLPAIKVSDHTDYMLKENDLVLTEILVIGYPPIQGTTVPSQVVALGQINSVVRIYHSTAIHFIASAMARGGYSGGVALDNSGTAIGLITSSLLKQDMAPELGYMTILSIEPAVDLAAEKFGFSVHGVGVGRYSETLFGARFIKDVDRPLSSFIYDANLWVYDNDQDVLVEINCIDGELLSEAVRTFEAVTPLVRHDVEDGSVLYTPKNNPSAKVLLEAAEAVVELFEVHRYRMMPAERSQWQLKLYAR